MKQPPLLIEEWLPGSALGGEWEVGPVVALRCGSERP
jgi:hypothetical protein